MFESVIVDLLNKHLGEYIENLDASQLKLGIWGGNAVLENLKIKKEALKSFNLPIQVKFGYIGKLVFKIPWKNLYEEPVELLIKDVFVLALPNTSFKYDAEQDATNLRNHKQALINSIEEEKLKTDQSDKSDKPDGFVEKLKLHIIRNVEIKVENIHIRYEDKTTFKNQTVCCGIFLQGMKFETTDENWIPKILVDNSASPLIYKISQLQRFTIYWNPNSKHFLSVLAEDLITREFQKLVVELSTDRNPAYNYIVKPITLQVKLRVNKEIDLESNEPRILIKADVNEIGVQLTRKQFHQISLITEEFEKMFLNIPFRKYRPLVTVKRNPNAWWIYSYKSVLCWDEMINFKQWTWAYIKNHRKTFKLYKTRYKEKLLNKTINEKTEEDLLKLEDQLDVFNVILARHCAETEVSQVTRQIAKKNHASNKSSWLGGWFKSWYTKEESSSPVDQAPEQLAAEEKRKFYQIIGYTEGEKSFDDNSLPVTYISQICDLNIQKITLELCNEEIYEKSFLFGMLGDVFSQISFRPSAKSYKINFQVSSMLVEGYKRGNRPTVIFQRSNEDDANKEMFYLEFEENSPLDSYDRNLIIKSCSAIIYYDSITVNLVEKFFQSPLHHLHDLKTAAYVGLKEQTEFSIMSTLDEHKTINVDIQMPSSYIILPRGGHYTGQEQLVVIDLGELIMKISKEDKSEFRKSSLRIGKELTSLDEDSTLSSELVTQVYDSYDISIKKIQVLFANSGDAWISARKQKTSPLHFIKPININFTLQICRIDNHADLPKLKVIGVLESFVLESSDTVFKNVVSLLHGTVSAKLPTDLEKKLQKPEKTIQWKDRLTQTNIASHRESKTILEATVVKEHYKKSLEYQKPLLKSSEQQAEKQMIKLQIDFIIQKVHIKLQEVRHSAKPSSPASKKSSVDVVSFLLKGAKFVTYLKTWENILETSIASCSIKNLKTHNSQGLPVELFRSHSSEDDSLLFIRMVSVERGSPNFHKVYNRTKQNISVKIGKIHICAHVQAIMQVYELLNKINFSLPLPAPAHSTTSETKSRTSRLASSIVSALPVSTDKQKRDSKIIDLLFESSLDTVSLSIEDKSGHHASLSVNGLTCGVVSTSSFVKVNLRLINLHLMDASSDAVHREIVKVLGDDLFYFEVFHYNSPASRINSTRLFDIMISMKLNQVQIFYINNLVEKLVRYYEQFTTTNHVSVVPVQTPSSLYVADSKRIQFDISLRAPTFIIPANSISLDAIYADLGNLKASNEFKLEGSDDVKYVVNEMTIKFDQMELNASNLILDRDGYSRSTNERQLVTKVNASLLIRSMVTEMVYPQLTINCIIPTIHLKLTQNDLTTVLSAFYNNIYAGYFFAADPSPPLPSNNFENKISSEISGSATSEVNEKDESAAKYYFQFDGMKISLYKNIERDDHLVDIEVLNFIVDCIGLKDETLTSEISIEQILLIDQRDSVPENKIKRLVKNKTGSDHFIWLKYVQEANGSTVLTAVVSSLSIIVNMEFSLELSSFLSFAILMTSNFKEVSDARRGVQSASSSSSQLIDNNRPIWPLKILATIHEPELVMVNDLTSFDVQAINFSFKLNFAYFQSLESEQKLKASLENLCIYVCPFTEAFKINSTNSKRIVEPCTLFLRASIEPNKQVYWVDMKEVRIKVSPAIINLLSEAFAQVFPPVDEFEKIRIPEGVQVSPWIPKKVDEMHTWYLKELNKGGKINKSTVVTGHRAKKLNQSLRFSFPQITAQMESGSFMHTVPLLLLECNLKGEVKNWSSGQMSAFSSITLGLAYFNDIKSVWEPLVEPVETDKESIEASYEPWGLTIDFKQNKLVKNPLFSEEKIPAQIHIDVRSQKPLQTVISSAAIKVLTELSGSFQDVTTYWNHKSAFEDTKTDHKTKESIRSKDAVITVNNDLGFDVYIRVEHPLYIVFTENNIREKRDVSVLKTSQTLLLDYDDEEDPSLWQVISNQLNYKNVGTSMFVSSIDKSATVVRLSKTGSFLNMIENDNGELLHFVTTIEAKAGLRTVTLRSHIKVKNFISVPLTIYLPKDDTSSHQPPIKFKVIEPNQTVHLPLNAIKHGHMFLKPTHIDTVHKCELSWKSVMEMPTFEMVLVVRCEPLRDSRSAVPFCINVDFKEDELPNKSGLGFDKIGLCINLYPCFTFRNLLPFEVSYKLSNFTTVVGEEKKLAAGDVAEIYDAKVGVGTISVKINNYQKQTWKSEVTLKSTNEEWWTFSSVQEPRKTITLSRTTEYNNGTMQITIYSPYWFVNHTYLPLAYKFADSEVQTHSSNRDMLLLFSFVNKKSNNRLQLKVADSLFSSSFNINAVGNDGTVCCKTSSSTFEYMIGTQIHLTSFEMTKVVTFTPYFSFLNQSLSNISFCEESGMKSWVKVKSSTKTPFWPSNSDKLVIALDDNRIQCSIPINYKKLESGVLIKVADRAFYYEVSIADWSLTVSIRDYFEGSSILLLVNACKLTSFKFWQSGSMDVTTVEPNKSVHFLWSNPNLTRDVMWSVVGGDRQKLNLFNEYQGHLDIRKIHYQVFFDGLQRVILLCDESKMLVKKKNFVQPDLVFESTFSGISFSLVDNVAKHEVAYMALNSSGVVWEQQKRYSWKPLTFSHGQHLEKVYNEDPTKSSVFCENVEYNLKEMKVVSPHQTNLRRIYTPALYAKFLRDDNYKSIQLKIHRLQVDNQTSGAVFPVAFAPYNLSKAHSANAFPKPLVEVFIVQHINENLTFTHFKYVKVLIQEFNIKLDVSFIQRILAVFTSVSEQATREQEFQYFLKDLASTTIKDETEIESIYKFIFYDLIHLSPIKLHLSFSMFSNSADPNEENHIAKFPLTALTTVVKSFGATIGDVDDIVFKLSFFERRFQFFNNQIFASVVKSHYMGQTIKQIYVVVLGLDVLGNPYGFVRGFAEGVTSLFYEPYQGIIQGPEEFLEGLGAGAMSLFENTVGGAAGAMSKMTGALGKGLAHITMDEDFKKERMKNKSKQSADAKESFARGGKSFFMGVVSGVTGVVTQPIEGAKKGGAAGFFKGFGKGLVGAVARPVGGVVDMAANTFEGIQRATVKNLSNKRLRPPRHIDEDSGVIQPYSYRKAKGSAMLLELNGGAYKHFKYVQHFPIQNDPATYLIITNRCALTTHSSGVFGQWKLDSENYFISITQIKRKGNTLQLFSKERGSELKKTKQIIKKENNVFSKGYVKISPVKSWMKKKANNTNSFRSSVSEDYLISSIRFHKTSHAINAHYEMEKLIGNRFSSAV